MALKLITLNVNGLADVQKRTLIYGYLKLLKADIYLLQETHNSTEVDENQWAREWGGPAVWSRGTRRSRGTALFFNRNLDINIATINRDNDGRLIAAKTFVNGIELNIMNIYAPTNPEERKLFFRNLWQYRTGDMNLLLGGDFNCVPDIHMDKMGGNPNLGDVGMRDLEAFITPNNLYDVWRVQHPRDRIYTWHNRDFSIRTRLDRWYISTTFDTTAVIRACPHSDHCTVELTFTLPEYKPRGPGTWKLNTTLLTNAAYKGETTAFLRYWSHRKAEFPSIHAWWDSAKEQLKGIAIKHSVRLSKLRHTNELSLINELTHLQAQPNPDHDLITRVEQQLKNIAEEKAKGSQVRSRATWLEKGERPTRYFFHLEKKKQLKNTIEKLKTLNGEVSSDRDILAHAREFYQTLYDQTDTDTSLQDWLVAGLDRKLSVNARNLAEGPITEPELDAAVEKLHLNKAPGPDGLPAEFYKCFWPHLKHDLMQLFNTSYDIGNLSYTQSNATIRLLYKKGDNAILKNWRPISLLNSDYKLLATALTNRLKPLLPRLIHEDQTCGIPGRTIFDSIFRLRDIAYDAAINNKNTIMINLDQEKAFDKVDRTYLSKVMVAMNFGPSFIHWINVLYQNANSNIVNNGWRSDPVILQRGVRQGCPLSPLLYVLVAETMAQAIRTNPRIRGVRIPGKPDESKLSQYADDGTLTVQDDLSVTSSFDTLRQYEQATGSNLNMGKTEGIYLGAQAGRPTGPVPIKWNTDAIPVLGTNIGNDLSQDWDKIAKKTEDHFERWKSRNLTIVGRTLLINTYALATITFMASIFVIPGHIINRIHKAMFQFLWEGKNELVARATCHLPRNRGGLGIPDLHNTNRASKSKWTRDIIDPVKTVTWLSYARYWLGIPLSTIHPDWRWLRDLRKPHADPNRMPPWYEILHDTITSLRDELQTCTTITNKILNNLLLQRNPPPRAEHLWITMPRPDFTVVWLNIWKGLTENATREMIWKATHRVLTTKQYLRSWGMNVNPSCPFCPQHEDMHHALFQCHRVQDLWIALQTWLNAINGTPVHLSLESTLLGIDTHHGLPELVVAQYMTHTALQLIWSTRNRAVADRTFQPVNLLHRFKDLLRQRIRHDNKFHKPYVDVFWTHKNVLCSLNQDQLTFMF